MTEKFSKTNSIFTKENYYTIIMTTANTIDEVISILDNIITTNKEKNDPLGYFAALYRKVTLKVKEGVENSFFENNERMEKLDVIFANRYIHAYYNYQENKPVTASWNIAFKLSKDYWPIVLQHLLIGMNAHINLDLGIAAAEVMKGHDINNLEGDFNKINEILSSLVNEVENELASIWPTLKKILHYTRKVDNFLVDFSMELARNGAWDFAKDIHPLSDQELDNAIQTRDIKVSKKAKIITNPGIIVSIIFGIIRLGERGSVKEKITTLQH